MTITLNVLKSRDKQACFLLYHLHTLHFAHTDYFFFDSHNQHLSFSKQTVCSLWGSNWILHVMQKRVILSCWRTFRCMVINTQERQTKHEAEAGDTLHACLMRQKHQYVSTSSRTAVIPQGCQISRCENKQYFSYKECSPYLSRNKEHTFVFNDVPHIDWRY